MHIDTPFNSLSHLLMNSAKSEKGITFIESNSSEDFLSYRELYKKAAYVLTKLQEQGLKPGHELVLQFQHNKHFIIAFWACILGKIIPVPITFGVSDEIILKLVNIWKLLNHPFLITDFPGFKENIALLEPGIENNEIMLNLRERIIYFDDVNVIYKKAEPIASNLDDIAFIQYSSGSTGNPKGVINTHKSIIYNIQVMSDFFDINDNDKILSWMPLTHDMGLIFFHLLPLFNGVQQYLIPPIVFLTYPSLWMSKASDHQITISGSPNFGYRHYLDHFDEKTMYNRSLEHMKYLVNGAEPISFQVCQQFVRTLAKFKLKSGVIRPSYGLAEATLGVSSVPLGEEFSQHPVHRDYLNVGDKVRFLDARDEHAVSYVDLGISFSTPIIITDEAGKQFPEKTVGYIKLKGPCVTRGYYNDPVTTGKTIDKDGWLNTGDLGFIFNQRLVIVGRAKEIVIINGQNYYPVDMERVAAKLEGIREGKIAVTSVFNGKMKTEEILAFIADGKYLRDLKEFVPLAAQLRLHFIDKIGIEVRKIIPIEKIPVTTSGKIQRYKLKERYLQGEFDEVIGELISLRQQMKPTRPNLSGSEMQEIIVDICKDVLKLEHIRIYDNFFELGGSSSSALRVKAKLEEALGENIDNTVIFKYPTINMLVNYLSSDEPGEKLSTEQKEHLESFSIKRRSTWERIKKHLTNDDETGKGSRRNGWEIAIIGMSGRFPGAKNIHQFWENIKNGVESISFFSEDELDEVGIDPGLVKDANYVKAKGVLDGIEYFDAAFFGYSPQDAEKMDPQMRISHECSWEALEDAGYIPGDYQGLIGVYLGASPNLQWESASVLSPSWRLSTSNQFVDTQLIDKDFMTTRLSYKLNLTGPSFNMYTACSTSLVAVDLACQGLWTGKCDMALAGGVSIWLPQKSGYLYENGMIFSRDGHNRTFAQQASGTVFSDGAGIVLLKRLEDALEDGDHIYSLVKGSAINNDGNRKAGYTAPALEGQAGVIVSALQMAGVGAESIGYLEAHGTATALGDTIEIDALKAAFQTSKTRYCAIGTVKSNIGHLNTAAGVAGLIKAVLMLKHGLIPPLVGFNKINPGINLDRSPFYINTRLKEWENGSSPRRSAVSSFGIGGTNAHVILEEWPGIRPHTTEDRPPQKEYQLILLSAKMPSSLDKMTQNLLEYFKNSLVDRNNHVNPANPGLNLADAAFTLQVGRQEFQHRRMAVCATPQELVDNLSNSLANETHTFSIQQENQEPAVVFMFAGLGSQYVNMGLDLYREEPVFREEMNRCFEILKPLMGYDIKEVLYPDITAGKQNPPVYNNSCSSNRSYRSNRSYIPQIDQTEIAQVVIFILEYALAQLLMKWGIKPDAMIGYSFGEYAAACISGVFSLEEALKLVVERGRLIQKIPPGIMLSVPLSGDRLIPLLDANHELELSLAIDNGASCIISGSPEAVNAFEKKLKEKKTLCIRVSVSHALHSRMMEPILKEFTEKTGKIKSHIPQIPYISNVTGDWLRADQLEQGYWSTHLRQTVRFSDGIKVLVKEMKNAVLVEIGPGRDLSAMVGRYIEDNPEKQIIHLLRSPQRNVSDVYFLLDKIGRLWLYGKKIHWWAVYGNKKRQRLPLPTYPFEGQQYQVETNAPPLGAVVLPGKESLDKKPDIADWFYIPSWKRSPITPANHLQSIEPTGIKEKSFWLLFAGNCGLGTGLAKKLLEKNQEVVIVKAGRGFSKVNDEEYTINPEKSSDYHALLDRFKTRIPGKNPFTIIHLWSVTGKGREESREKTFEHAQRMGLYSLVFLAKATREVELSGGYRFIVISNNIQEITGEEELCPAKSTILGPIKVIPQEYPHITCRSIDIVLASRGTWQEQRLLEQLTDECLVGSRDITAAYRNNYRWVQTFEPFRLEEAPGNIPRLRQRGVYLITGGIGGIGHTLAGYLARTVRAKLILTGGSPFPARENWEEWLSHHSETDRTGTRINRIRGLEKQGAEVLVFAADSADREEMEQVIARSEEKFGAINGVIHAAGIVGGKSFDVLDQLDETAFKLQFQPKVYGLLVLEEIFRDRALDFCLVTSSLSPILGGLTLGAYAAANQFMDSFVHWHNRKSPAAWMSLNWGDWQPWDQSGQESGIGAELAKLNMTPEEGVESFRRILHHGKGSQIIVSAGDLKSRIHQWVERETLWDAAKPGEKKPTILHQRPTLLKSFPYEAPRSAIEKTLVDTWQQLFGFEPIGIRDDFFELGGDSLKAVMAAYKIHKVLELEIPLKEFFDRPTIAGLADYINTNKEKRKQHVEIRMVETKEYYVLSPVQKRLYFLQKLDKESITYNETLALILEGLPDYRMFEEVFRKLIERQESYRTSFIIVNDEPMQRIWSSSDVDFKIQRLSTHSTASMGSGRTPSLSDHKDKQEEVEDIEEKIRNFIRPFDLSQAPFLRILLMEISQQRYILVMDKHHIVNDGHSNQVFVKEMTALYAEEKLPRLRLQYKDYAEWQNSHMQQKVLEKEEVYWLGRFQDEIPVLNLPTDYPRPSFQGVEGNTSCFQMGKEEAAALNKLASKENTTLYVILLSGFHILLSKLSGQEDIIIGTAVTGRRYADLEQIIGMFVNTLPLRNVSEREKTFSQFIQDVKVNTLNALENRDYPLEKLVEQISVNRDISRNPLFDVMFALHKVDFPQVELPGLTMKLYNYTNRTSKFDLTLEVLEEAGKLRFAFEYSTALFKTETIKRFNDYLKKILLSALENPVRKISGIEIISEEEIKQILYDFNAAYEEHPKNKTIHQLFEKQAEKKPDSTALRGYMDEWMHEGVHITYRELNKISNRLAFLLIEKGVKPDTIVGIMAKRSIEMIVGILGILKAGGAYLPIYPGYPGQRIRYMLKDSNAKILVTTRYFAKEGETAANLESRKNLEIVFLDFSTLPSSHPNLSPAPVTSLAYIIYTSGSTGNPKGVPITHCNISPLLHWGYGLGIDSHHRVTQNLSYFFDWSVWEIFITLTSGAGLYTPDEETMLSPEQSVAFITQHAVTVLHITPTQFNYFLETRGRLEMLEYLFIGAEKLTHDMVKRSFEVINPHCRVFNMYGPTEATIISAVLEIHREVDLQDEMLSSVPIGGPMANGNLLVMDKYMKLCPINVTGELVIAGDGVAMGYLNNAELTAEKFDHDLGDLHDYHDGYHKSYRSYKSYITHSSYYRTGDLARWLPDGNIEFLGRMDRQVKVRGFRIELGEIEKQLLKHEKVKDAVVVIKAGAVEGKYICAYIVSHHEISASELRDYLSKYLPGYMIPSYFHKLEKITLTPNGKIDIGKLESFALHLDTGIEHLPPKTEIEKQIAAIWRDILKVDKIGLNDNFFEIGGNSMKVISLNRKLDKALSMEIPTVIFFERMTIRLFVEYLTGMEKKQTGSKQDVDRSDAIKKMKQKRTRRKAKRGDISNV